MSKCFTYTIFIPDTLKSGVGIKSIHLSFLHPSGIAKKYLLISVLEQLYLYPDTQHIVCEHTNKPSLNEIHSHDLLITFFLIQTGQDN